MPGADPIDARGVRSDRLGPASLLVLARAHRRNALDAALLTALGEALAAAADARDPALVLCAEGEAFCTGMDFSALAADSGSSRPLHQSFADVLRRLGDLPGLSVAVVEGDALGGGLALAAACDVVIATPQARFGLPEAVWGLIPANAAPVVARRCGVGAARRLALITEPVDAGTALRLGLIDHLATDRTAALGIARRLCLRAARVGSEGLVAVKQCFRRLDDDPAGYAAWAEEAITAASDAPALRARLAAANASGERP